jgi:hypothetical protein
MVSFALAPGACAAMTRWPGLVTFDTAESATIVSAEIPRKVLPYLQVAHPVRTLDALARDLRAIPSIV